jgi:hypothetical protein
MILEAKDQLESNTFAQVLAEAYDKESRSLFINADVSEVSILWTPANLPIR